MAETELLLTSTINATFDANGNAVASIGVGPNRRWVITLLNTRTTSTTQTRHWVRRNTPSTGQQLDFSRTGNGDTSSTSIELKSGEKLIAEWTGGTPGALASLDFEGTEYLKGQRAYGVQ